jgi:hypothetical protein
MKSTFFLSLLAVSLNILLAANPVAAPQNLILEPSIDFHSTSMVISWSDTSDNAEGYILEYSKDNWETFTSHDTIKTGNSYTHNNLIAGELMYYRIFAYQSDIHSDTIYGVHETYYQQIYEFRGHAKSKNSILVAWEDWGSHDRTGYIIERSDDSGITFDSLGTVSWIKWQRDFNYTDTTALEQKDYYYRILAYNPVVENVITIEPLYVKISQEGSWVRLTDYPGTRLDGGKVFFYDDLVYAGLGEGDEFWAYNPKLEEWQEKSALPVIYKPWGVGGQTTTHAYYFRYINYADTAEQSVDTLWQYSFADDEWTAESVTPFKPRSMSGGFTDDSCVYFISSYDYDNHVIWAYNFISKAWTEKNTSLLYGYFCSFYKYNEEPRVIFYSYPSHYLRCKYNFEINDFEVLDTLGSKENGKINSIFTGDTITYIFRNNSLYTNPDESKNLEYITNIPGKANREYVNWTDKGTCFLIGGAGNGYTDEFWSYTSGSPYSPGKLISTYIGADTLGMQWDDMSEVETGYVLERSLSSSNEFLVLDTLAVNTTSYLDTLVEYETVYNYRVKGINNIGASGYSNVLTIKTLPEYVDDSEPSSLISDKENNTSDVSIFYNPESSEAIVETGASKPGNYTFYIYNLSGQLIQTDKFYKTEDTAVFTIQTSQLADGIYIISISGPSGIKSQKIMIH